MTTNTLNNPKIFEAMSIENAREQYNKNLQDEKMLAKLLARLDEILYQTKKPNLIGEAIEKTRMASVRGKKLLQDERDFLKQIFKQLKPEPCGSKMKQDNAIEKKYAETRENRYKKSSEENGPKKSKALQKIVRNDAMLLQSFENRLISSWDFKNILNSFSTTSIGSRNDKSLSLHRLSAMKRVSVEELSLDMSRFPTVSYVPCTSRPGTVQYAPLQSTHGDNAKYLQNAFLRMLEFYRTDILELFGHIFTFEVKVQSNSLAQLSWLEVSPTQKNPSSESKRGLLIPEGVKKTLTIHLPTALSFLSQLAGTQLPLERKVSSVVLQSERFNLPQLPKEISHHKPILSMPHEWKPKSESKTLITSSTPKITPNSAVSSMPDCNGHGSVNGKAGSPDGKLCPPNKHELLTLTNKMDVKNSKSEADPLEEGENNGKNSEEETNDKGKCKDKLPCDNKQKNLKKKRSFHRRIREAFSCCFGMKGNRN